MSWIDRLRQEITLVSPKGSTFTPHWAGNERSFQRNVGVFNFPGMDGAETQDLGSGAEAYPLTLLFEGEDNDLEATRFFTSCKERGFWQVTHPVKGLLELILLSVVERVSPVESGNVTRIDTEWLKSNTEIRERSLAEIKYHGESSVEGLNTVAVEQIEQNTIQETALQRYSIISGVSKILQYSKERLYLLYAPVAALSAEMDSIRSSIINGIEETVLDITAIAAQVQSVVQFPAMTTEDAGVRLSAYSNLLSDIFTLPPDNTDPTISIKTPGRLKNEAAVKELGVTAVLGAIVLVAISGEYDTRAKALSVIDRIADHFSDSVIELDKYQTLLSGENIDLQYFSQHQSFADAFSAISNSLWYILKASYDLAVEKRFVLKKPRAPIEIVISEYGSDEYLDSFIGANALSAERILLLPAGTEVVVYV